MKNIRSCYPINTFSPATQDEIIEFFEKREERLLKEYKEALIWCSGSEDFQYPDGKARKGWEKIVKPLIK